MMANHQSSEGHVDASGHNVAQPRELDFYIFGHNISHSLSPALHNAAFRVLNLPYIYSIHETKHVDSTVERAISRSTFGGASVTFPHKLEIGRLLDTIAPSAQKVGAVNTIVVKHGNGRRLLIGENTDWSGIKACIVKSGISDVENAPALVVGAGGAARAACYALTTLGVPEILVVNRTRSKAEEMVSRFPRSTFRIFAGLEELRHHGPIRCRVVVACVLADDLVESKVPGEIFSGVESGVLIEMAYRPLVTGMMKVAGEFPGWKIFNGPDVLREQAFAQFELWTGREAPIPVMEEAMHAEMEQRDKVKDLTSEPTRAKLSTSNI